MKGKWQPIDGKSRPDLRAEVNEHVFRLNQVASSLRRLVRRAETVVDEMVEPEPELVDILAATERQVDLIYQTMVQVRWSALGTNAAQGLPRPENRPDSPPVNGVLKLGRATVFVIDGDPTSLKALSHLFQNTNYRVEAYSSVRQYLAHQPLAYPACILANVPTIDQDGPELQRLIIEADSRIPVIFLAGRGKNEEVVQPNKDGASDFLIEYCDQHDLLAAVKRALQGDLHRRNP